MGPQSRTVYGGSCIVGYPYIGTAVYRKSGNLLVAGQKAIHGRGLRYPG